MQLPQSSKKLTFWGQNWLTFRALRKHKENLYFNVLSAAIPYGLICHHETYKSWLEYTAIKALWFASQNARDRIFHDLHFKISFFAGGGGGHAFRPPRTKSVSAALGCQSDQQYYTRNTPMQRAGYALDLNCYFSNNASLLPINSIKGTFPDQNLLYFQLFKYRIWPLTWGLREGIRSSAAPVKVFWFQFNSNWSHKDSQSPEALQVYSMW